jgi:predicted ATPase/class 3 adenylate cyclase/Tfp pilus assembly protein PilF
MTHAILLTDLVDSTRLSQALGDEAMALVWAAHDRLARDLLPLHGGREYDRTDGFLFLFDTVADAAAYAVAYHRALRAADPPLQARAGLHLGPLRLLHNTPEDVARGAKPVEVDGAAKPLAAQVMALASGGQTLLTAEAYDAVGGTSLRAESHGHWRIKGIAEPLELFGLGDDAAPFDPPADTARAYRVVRQGEVWLPARDIPHSLPRERDTFVGRHDALGALTGRIEAGAALVSVLGIGGTGKTRLVTRFGWTCLGDWPGGVWFCDLSEARDAEGIVAAVAKALDVPLGKDDPVVQLGHTLASRGRCLVLLDNFEQVARHAAETLGRWLDCAPDACFVVTTREVLGLPGEVVLALAPLDVDESVDLFVARAAQARLGFTLSPSDAPHVESLVRLLDGLPLAIELAAARVRVMTPETIRARMGERFELLASAGARHTRQATLRGALDWSWDLLSPDEQQALAQLAVFEGGFTLEGAEAVLVLDDLWPLDAVQALVDKSLVRALAADRFDLLVSVQVYAAEKLEGLGGTRAAEERHGRRFAAFGNENALAALKTHGGTALRQALTPDLDNLVVAVRRAIARADGAVAVPALRAAWQVLEVHGPLGLAADLAAEVVALRDLPRDLAGHALLVRVHALRVLGRSEDARADCETALADFRAVGDHRMEVIALGALAGADLDRARYDEARAGFDAALALAVAIGDLPGKALILRLLGNLDRTCGRNDDARARLEEAREHLRTLGDRPEEGWCLNVLGILMKDLGRLEEARAYLEAALAVARETGSRRAQAVVIGNLGDVHREQGRMEEALADYETALELHRRIGNRRLEGMVLGNMGNLRSTQGQTERALASYAAALSVQRDAGNRRSEAVVLANLGSLLLVQGRMDEALAHFEASLELGRQLGHQMLEGYALFRIGLMHLRRGRPEEAQTLLETALALVRTVGQAVVEGAILGHLGAVKHRRGHLDDALAHYASGVALLREARSPEELGKVLCSRTGLWLATGQRDLALQDLTEAEAIVEKVKAGSASELGQMLAEARAALGVG